MVSDTVEVKREALEDLLRIRKELDVVMESLELMKNKEFMNSYRKAKKEIKNREFADWDDL